MTVYKYFLKIALKHKWIIISYTVIFFILSIINGSATGKTETIFMEKSLDIGVVDESNSELSISFIKYLEDDNILTTMENDKEYIQEQIFLEAIDAVIIIPKDFENLVINKKESIEIMRDERKLGSVQVENEINKFLIFANATYSDGKFDLSKVENVLDREIEVEVLKVDDYKKDNGVNTWFKYYFNYTGYIIIAIYVAVIGLLMLEINDKNIQDRMKVSSKKFFKFNMEIYLGQVTLAILITSIFILGSVLLKGKYIAEINFSKYLLNIFTFSFAILGFTFLINNLTNSRFVINGISSALSLGTAFISGVMVPQEFLADNVLRIAKFFPTYYFVKINEMNTNSFLDIKYEIFMQVLFGIFFFLIGLYFSKVKRSV
ncbi:ABC transporter permease [Tissierella creatinophila]|uniref:ABC-2 family transporter protein n=1 Tax=Tissierella creatinophila DSM 6911 TaxID=1123403 RepID=A0A1U7M741_TISCR|nr:ABC transporter permease [Tissierella creatinophila]OLS03070.1 ABC-2 family transporter protein [Tissierella creatinophila DSM 6911]